MSELDFDGRVAIVTGAGNGLGRAYALWLAARGAKVVVNNRRHADRPWSAEAVVREIEAAGGSAIAEGSDAIAPDCGEAMVKAAIDAFGRVDILIANAAANAARLVVDQSLEQLRENLELNFFGAVKPVIAVLPHFMAQDFGRIVLTTSAVALFGSKTRSAYAASKMAQVGFARTLAVETGSTGIRVNVISPYAYTNMSQGSLPENLKTLMAPEKVAPVVGWLSHESCSVTGLIFSAGAGRVRRAALFEGAIVDLEGGPLADKIDALLDTSAMVETRNSGRSGLALIPELKPST